MRFVLLGLMLLLAPPASARSAGAFALCEAAIAAAETEQALPPGLLAAIGLVETGRRDAVSGAIRSWPWSVNAEGADLVFDTAEAAIAAVAALQARGLRSIDVGCLQINLLQHPSAFATSAEAFDPASNVAYAARFLRSLFAESGDWATAAAAYHSRTPERGLAYQQLVLRAWRVPGAGPWLGSAEAPPPARPFMAPALVAAPATASAGSTLLAAMPTCGPDAARDSPSWTMAGRASCGKSPFASVARLRQVLAQRVGRGGVTE